MTRLFNMLVHHFYSLYEQHCGTGAGITPSEIREASGYAWQKYMECHGQPEVVITQQEGRTA